MIIIYSYILWILNKSLYYFHKIIATGQGLWIIGLILLYILYVYVLDLQEKENIYVYEILHKNHNNLLIIDALRDIMDAKTSSTNKKKLLFLDYYNQKIHYSLKIKANKIYLEFRNPIIINGVKIKSFIFKLSCINKITHKKYHLPMYLESIEYVLQQKGNFNYYGEILHLLQNIIPQVKQRVL